MPGLFFEDMHVGTVLRHEVTRTVTDMDNVLFTSLTMNPQPLHLDVEFAAKSIHGRPVFNSLFTIALIGGMSVMDTTFGTTIGNLGYDSIRLPHPVFSGDTLRAETTIADKRRSKSRTDAGIVWFEHRGYNQNDVLVCECRRVGMILYRPTEERGVVTETGPR